MASEYTGKDSPSDNDNDEGPDVENNTNVTKTRRVHITKSWQCPPGCTAGTRGTRWGLSCYCSRRSRRAGPAVARCLCPAPRDAPPGTHPSSCPPGNRRLEVVESRWSAAPKTRGGRTRRRVRLSSPSTARPRSRLFPPPCSLFSVVHQAHCARLRPQLPGTGAGFTLPTFCVVYSPRLPLLTSYRQQCDRRFSSSRR